MADRKRVNGVPVVEGLTHAEYMKIWRAPNTVKAIMEAGKTPDPRWLRMLREARLPALLGLAAADLYLVSRAIVLHL